MAVLEPSSGTFTAEQVCAIIREERAEVERLRANHALLVGEIAGILSTREALRKAEHEIGRLRVQYAHPYAELQAKVERLREALSWYAETPNYWRQPNPRANESEYQTAMLDPAIYVDNGRRAREALNA